MRLFTGIDLPEEIAERLGHLVATLRTHAHLKWSPVYNLHVTTKFIGEWPEQKRELLETTLAALPKRMPFQINIAGLGWFPNPHQPRVFWAGVRVGPELEALAREIDVALKPLGVEPEKRAYAPHLTLARVLPDASLQALRQAVAQLESIDFGNFEANRFFLYLSKPGQAHSVYVKLAEFPFEA